MYLVTIFSISVSGVRLASSFDAPFAYVRSCPRNEQNAFSKEEVTMQIMMMAHGPPDLPMP
jgi:hypothetical protein